MQYAVKTLVDVMFEHSYFTKPFEGLKVSVPAATERSLVSNGLYCKPFPGGFRILYECSRFKGHVRSREDVLKENVLLNLCLEIADPAFYSYTDAFASDISNHILYFSNYSRRGSLHKEEHVTGKDVHRYSFPHAAEQYDKKPFAKVLLRLSGELPGSYSIRFKAASVHWRYILMNKNLAELKSPAILDIHAQELFGEPVEIELPAGKKALAIVSNDPIKLSARPVQAFQLVENFEAGQNKHRLVMRSLPGPDINRISLLPSLAGKGPENCSDIFIY